MDPFEGREKRCRAQRRGLVQDGVWVKVVASGRKRCRRMNNDDAVLRLNLRWLLEQNLFVIFSDLNLKDLFFLQLNIKGEI